MHLELNEGSTSFDIPHNLVVSGQALVPRTGGLNVSWVVRALSGSPFSLTNSTIDPDRNGSQSEPLAAGNYSGTTAPDPADNYTVKSYKTQRNGARRPRLHERGCPVRLPLRAAGQPPDRASTWISST